MSEIILRVEAIALWGHHGCERCEVEKGGPFTVSLEAAYAEPADTRSDTFTDRPDYALMAERAAALFSEKRYQLVEPLGAVIAETLLEEFPSLTRLRVTIRKLEPVIALKLDYSEVSVERHRAKRARAKRRHRE